MSYDARLKSHIAEFPSDEEYRIGLQIDQKHNLYGSLSNQQPKCF